MAGEGQYWNAGALAVEDGRRFSEIQGSTSLYRVGVEGLDQLQEVMMLGIPRELDLPVSNLATMHTALSVVVEEIKSEVDPGV